MTLISTPAIITAVGGVVAILVLVWFVRRRSKRSLNPTKFQTRWQDIQQLCSSAETWPLAIINADKLLDDALKKSRYKGRGIGERLVAAQRDLSDNDGIWYAHKLRNKLVHEEYGKLKQREVLKVLTSYRQALKDLGALR